MLRWSLKYIVKTKSDSVAVRRVQRCSQRSALRLGDRCLFWSLFGLEQVQRWEHGVSGGFPDLAQGTAVQHLSVAGRVVAQTDQKLLGAGAPVYEAMA